MILEYEDIARFIPQLRAEIYQELKREVESEKFISYPRGMQVHLCDGLVADKTYKRVRKLWNERDFPRRMKAGIKGVYLSELKEYLG